MSLCGSITANAAAAAAATAAVVQRCTYAEQKKIYTRNAQCHMIFMKFHSNIPNAYNYEIEANHFS